MTFSMPPTFPQDTFQEFGKRASELFPVIPSDETPNDLLQKQQHFERALWAVAYRYRACSELNEAFRALLQGASDHWRKWNADEELNYRLEQCLYHFFANCVSVFDSLAFCLYFVGAMMAPEHFPYISKPNNIKLKTTTSAFASAFPNAPITEHLWGLSENPEFKKIKTIRNILAHRIIGRRNIHICGTTGADGKYTKTREEIWYIPGSNERLEFSEKLIQHHLEETNRLLTTLVSVSLEFVKSERRK
ncbi:MAG: hypothetical protein JRJ31_21500 [Deltaproteobacteria bacterium]|nr:hypothetical protein [Deltaproteobacteria bacterium]